VLAVLPHAHWIISATRCTQCFWCRWCPARSFFHLFDFYQRFFRLRRNGFMIAVYSGYYSCSYDGFLFKKTLFRQ